MTSKKTKIEKNIFIKGAHIHNLKHIDVEIPRNKFIVVTGVSGSGKSSLTIDTLYAEGQRRYVESLSSYARQFLVRMDKPDVEYINGICPAIALEQKVNTKNPRSTVGTTSEIYDYLRLLFARIGKTISPVSNKEVKKHTVSDVMDKIKTFDEGMQINLYLPLHRHDKRSFNDEMNLLLQKGFLRVLYKKELVHIEDILEKKVIIPGTEEDSIQVLVDRFIIKKDDTENENRMADSIQTSFYEGDGVLTVEVVDRKKNTSVEIHFSNKFEMDGIIFQEPNVHLFSFNSPYGVCQTCEGFGSILGIDEDLVIPDKSLSIYESAIACWRGEKMKKWKERLINSAEEFDFPIHKPFSELTHEQQELVWTGNKHFKGINRFFEYLNKKKYKIQYRVLISRYRGKMDCTECDGTRLRKEANYVKIDNHSISQLLQLSIDDLRAFFNDLTLTRVDKEIGKRLLTEIEQRLTFLVDVGLGYLSLNRGANTLSGGESQRINLARFLGSHLISSMYILDEPSIGLHQRDTQLLIKVLLSLRDLKNTVVVVEHDEETMAAADHIIDMGPFAGQLGGEIIFEGTYKEILKSAKSLTGAYLSGRRRIEIPKTRRKSTNSISVLGARQNNLKNIDVNFPLNIITVVTGVSGSGKTSLIKEILWPALNKTFDASSIKPGQHDRLTGDIDHLYGVQLVDQNPIGRSSRSNPLTYIKSFDAIRHLFANQQLAKIRGYKTSHFSFNIEGGRCDLCKGEGEIVVEMQFMADVHLLCEACKGRRFKQATLDIQYKGKSISDVLEMTVDESIEFFKGEKEIKRKLQALADVGLGYLLTGQSSTTLSGGEAQRIKLASFLGDHSKTKPTLFIFDEPTIGLHAHDIQKLLSAFNALIEQGHTVIVIEHNMDVIKTADWIIDLGPEGGDGGGYIVCEGVPEEVAKHKESYTAGYLKKKLVDSQLPAKRLVKE
ncbi:MAG: excinuclease ABC subunit UvrA [Bacteroidetes bacterium]|nr:excinuclease ABC subunit UvrA [Bacteroidota bacterium]